MYACSPRSRWLLPLLVQPTPFLLPFHPVTKIEELSTSSWEFCSGLDASQCMGLCSPAFPSLLWVNTTGHHGRSHGTGLAGVGGVSEENQLCDLYWAQGAWLPLAKAHSALWPLHLALKSRSKNNVSLTYSFITECLVSAENEQMCLGQNKVRILTDQHGGNSKTITQILMQLWDVMMLAAKWGRYPKGQTHILMHLQSVLCFGSSWSLFWKRAKCTQKYSCMTCFMTQARRVQKCSCLPSFLFELWPWTEHVHQHVC